jgi:hypothetical protein
MQRLSEKLDGYTISSILKEYCADLRELELEERVCIQQPISRYESDFVSVTNAKELLTLYRKDYITEVDEIDGINVKDVAFGKLGLCDVDNLQTATTSASDNLVNDFQFYFGEGDSNKKLPDLELLSRIDAYLDSMDRSKRGYAELLKSVPTSAFNTYKEKLTKRAESNTLIGVALQDLSTKKEAKEPGRRRGGFKRKLVGVSAVKVVCVIRIRHFDRITITE